MRRGAPRRLEDALEQLSRRLAPATTLARVERAWSRAAGEALREEAHPVAERAGVVTLGCRSAVWAEELQLMSRELAERLNDAVETDGGGRPVQSLRFVVRSG